MLSSLAFTGWQFYQGHESPQLKQHRNPGAYRESEGRIFTLLGDARVADYATSAVSIVLNLEKSAPPRG